jgi:uncharacterized C2H2 Zn-finger protein
MAENIDKTGESVCKYNKYGYCKFKEKCRRLHIKKTCENNASCTNIKSCLKRHPKVCKLHDLYKSRRFGSDCSYLHTKSKKESENDERLEYLENCLKDMTEKVKGLEEELSEIKANINSAENKAKEVSSQDKEIIKYLKCDICEYKTNREVTLKKHKNTKHVTFKCTDCGQNFKSQNTLEKHVNREHKIQEIEDDNECPICGKLFITKKTMQDHFKESHMNPIDIRKKPNAVGSDIR